MSTTQKRVLIGARVFIVTRDEKGNPVRVVERKVYAPGKPWEAFHNQCYWSAKHHPLPKRETSLIARILAAG